MPLTLPDPARAALLLDMDGTLLDIAPTPDAVRVAPGLAEALATLRGFLCGGLAMVTGRPIGQVDALFPGVPYAVAGEHGGAIRAAPGATITRPELPSAPAAWLDAGERLVARHPGALLERKQRGFVLHYRGAPEAGPGLEAALRELIAEDPTRFQLMPALMAWEVRPTGADKGSATLALMGAVPFAGRLPIFIGDDVTDEDGMEAARSLGGAGLRVDRFFNDPGGVRAWLMASASALPAGSAWPDLPGPGAR